MRRVLVLAGIAALFLGVCLPAAAADNPFVGHWALTIPSGGAGWLGVTQEDGYLDARILWGGGSVVPTASAWVEGDTLYVLRLKKVERKKNGKVVLTQQWPTLITAQRSGENLYLKEFVPNTNGKGTRESDFTGKWTPAPGPKPDLSKVKYGAPIELFNGKNLDGWRLTNENQRNGWSAVDGVLDNNPVQPEGEHYRYGNLRTDAEFKDFNLKLEVEVPENGNSGIYLRGIYEIQVSDSYGKPLDAHNMGGLYSRIKPAVNAEKPAGQWQSMDITLVDRHITVILNGKTIIDNEPALGCTGGALWSDPFKAGPIYLQGDHRAVKFRNMVLTPVVE